MISDDKILQKAKSFYSSLYSSSVTNTSQESERFFNSNDSKLKKVNGKEQKFCEELLTKDECLAAYFSHHGEKQITLFAV